MHLRLCLRIESVCNAHLYVSLILSSEGEKPPIHFSPRLLPYLPMICLPIGQFDLDPITHPAKPITCRLFWQINLVVVAAAAAVDGT